MRSHELCQRKARASRRDGRVSDPQDLVDAIEKVRAEGYTKLDAYTRFPSKRCGKRSAITSRRFRSSCLLGGIFGGLCGFFLQYWVSAIEYPLNVGGRPLNSWPAFIPVTFECTILGRGPFGGVGVFIINGLPEPYHPVFNVAALRLRLARSLLPLHRSNRPQVRPRPARKLLWASTPGGRRCRALGFPPAAADVGRLGVLALCSWVCSRPGCRNEMYDQAKTKPLSEGSSSPMGRMRGPSPRHGGSRLLA